MTVKKNICITINSLVDGGAEKQSLLLAKALQSYHNTCLVILNPEPIYAPRLVFLEEEKVRHVFLPKNPIKKFSVFNRFLKNNEIEVVFSFLPSDTIWAAICGKITGVPFVFGGIRNSHIARKKFIALRFANNNLLKYTIANNFSAYTSALEFGFKPKVFVIANGIEIRPLVQNEKTNPKEIHIISVGRLVKQKGYLSALKTISELKKSLANDYQIRYTIVGSGSEEAAIISDINRLKLQDEVRIIKNASNVYQLLEAADMYLCTSSFEGISNSIMEAMNCALPVVATNAGDNARLIIDNENGFITAIDDVQSLKQGLLNLIESPDLRLQMGMKGYQHLIQNFGFVAFQNKYLNLLENITNIDIQEGEFCLKNTANL